MPIFGDAYIHLTPAFLISKVQLCPTSSETYHLFNLVGGYIKNTGVLLQQALFPDLECAVEITFYA